MTGQFLSRATADRLGQFERHLRDRSYVLPATLAAIVASFLLHALLGAPSFVLVTALSLTVAALVIGEMAILLAVAAAIVHAVIDVIRPDAMWGGATTVRSIAVVAAALFGAGVGVIFRRYEETRRRSQDEDPITGLLNVRAFYDQLYALREHDKSYAILIADIAGMRSLNERYGHPMGTEAMRALGHVLRRSTKETDLVARLGSDEVVVALVGADRTGAVAAARRLSALLADELVTLPDGRTFRVHAYYGIATSADIPDEISLLRAADHAKSAAKQQGPDEIGMAADATDSRFLIFHPGDVDPLPAM